jgi:two-component system, OmpR family, sensor kinase
MATFSEVESNAQRLLATLQQLFAIDAQDMMATLTEASMLLGDTLQAEKVDIFFYDPQRATLTALGTSETPLAHHQRAIGMDQLPLANGGREVETFQTGQSYWTSHAEQDQGMLPGVVQGLGARSVLIVPLSISTSRRGVIAVTSTTPDRFSEQDLRFLETVAYWVGLVIHRASLSERLKREARHQGHQRATTDFMEMVGRDMHDALVVLEDMLRQVHELQDDPTAHTEAIDTAVSLVQRMHTIIDNLHHVQSLEPSVISEPLSVDVLAVTRDVAKQLASAETPIQVASDFTDIIIMTDPAQVHYALENLLLYAVHHSPRHCSVQVTLEVEPDENGEWQWAEVMIQDWGPRISSELIAQLGERVALDGGLTRLGIGVFLASRFAAALGGDVSVDSSEDAGTFLTLRLPRLPQPATQQTRVIERAIAPRLPVDARRSDLSDAQWQAVQGVLPAPKPRGRKPTDLRRITNGILYVLRTESTWRQMPRRYGHYVTCWRYYIRWQGDGTWQRIQQILNRESYVAKEVDSDFPSS